MRKLLLAGAGNLAWSLAHELANLPGTVCAVTARNEAKGKALAASAGCAWAGPPGAKPWPEVDGILLAVPDRAIVPVARELAPLCRRGTWMAHLSGATDTGGLAGVAPLAGALYPLQTFTAGRHISWKSLPVFWEGPEAIGELARELSDHSAFMDSEGRLRIHLAAVWASNFTNALLGVAKEWLPGGTGLEVLEPLVKEQVKKAFEIGPAAAQTGPALRGDEAVMEKHLELLADHPDLQTLYVHISRQIRTEPNRPPDVHPGE